MIKELQKVVDFTSRECLNVSFKPVVSTMSGLAHRPIDCIITDDELIMGNEHILLNTIQEVEVGYYEDLPDRLEKVYCDSLEEVIRIVESRRNGVTVPMFGFMPMGSYFPFYEVDKIGGGFVTIKTEDEDYGIYYPTKQLTNEKSSEQ